MSRNVLVIDDERTLADNISKYLARSGFHVETAYSGQDGLAKCKSSTPNLVLLDLRLGDMDGVEVLKQIRHSSGATKVILMTAFGSINIAVDAMKAGADEFLTKPIVLKRLGDLVQDMLGLNTEASVAPGSEDYLSCIIGESPAIRTMKDRVRALLANENALSVLITGETGTGKELLAKAIHYGSKRSGGPFIEVNCTALPENLIESELFGHEKGAFTGAPTRKIGLFEAASGGTLFLDEIGDMPMPLQAKLLKAIEDKEVRPVGAIQSRKVDVRIVAATNCPIEHLVSGNRLRSDLYFRLNGFRIDSPPLLRRDQDVLLLADHFLDVQARCYQRPRPRLSPQTKQLLLSYSWPGNVRELRNVLEQAMLLTSGDVLGPEHLALPVASNPGSEGTVNAETEMNLRDSEKQLLLRALGKTGWNVTAAAKLLSVSRDTLRYRIKRFGITPRDCD